MVRAIRKSIDNKPKALQLCVFGEATKQEKGVPHTEKYWPDVYYMSGLLAVRTYIENDK